MKRITIIIAVLALLCPAFAQQEQFNQANELYAAGQYADAANMYEQCLTDRTLTAKSRAAIYYNLGNARFKQEELAQSILAYERCLRLNPTNKDARYNLRFAQSRIVDNIADNNHFFLSTWLTYTRNLLPAKTWLWISISMFILCLIGALGFALCKEMWLRKTAFHIAWIVLLISIGCGLNAASLHKRDTLKADAIIVQGVVNAKSSPDKSGTDLFTLHEGTKVTIHETLGDWCNIHVGNNVGWIRLNNLERI